MAILSGETTSGGGSGCFAGRAQQANCVRRIAVLMSGAEDDREYLSASIDDRFMWRNA